MASAVPVEMIDDDDDVSYSITISLAKPHFTSANNSWFHFSFFLHQDFDWEAAVREIDVACGEAIKQSSSGVTTTTSATIYRNSNLHTGSYPKIENNKPSSSRQSTLDRFIGSTGLKSTNQDARHDAQDKVECNDERVSDVSIDPEAAKTWIYPGICLLYNSFIYYRVITR